MDFIERFLHISPDGGNGSLEFLIVTSIILVIVSAIVVARNQLVRLFWWGLKELRNRKGEERFDS